MSYFFSLLFCSLPVFSGCQAWGVSEILLVSKMGGRRSLWTTKASPPPLESLPAQRLPFPFSALEQGVKPSTVLVPDQGLVLASSPGGWTRTVPALRWRQRHRHRSQVHSSTNGLGTKPSNHLLMHVVQSSSPPSAWPEVPDRWVRPHVYWLSYHQMYQWKGI